MEALGGGGGGKTHVAPDGQDEHHGDGQSVVEGGEAANLGEAVAVVEGDGAGLAELGVDGVGVGGDALDVGDGDLDGLAVLDEDLVHAIGLEAGDDAESALLAKAHGNSGGGGTHVKGLLVSTVLPLP